MTALLSTKQVADLKGVTVQTVNGWAREGMLEVAVTVPTSPGRSVSGARLFDPSVVAAFVPPSQSTTTALEDYTEDEK